MALRNLFFCLVAAAFWPVSIIKGETAIVPYETVLTKSANVQEEIVNKHNALRRRVIPQACNMLKMEWNENAAQNARNWSKVCEKDHSPQVKRIITNILFGENLLFASLPISWSDAIQMWYDESKNFTYGYGPINPESNVGHYTQTVWSTSYMIGCGVAHCPNQQIFKYFYTCHYCHGGNNPATFTTPYKKGIPCGDCPGQCENKLCTNPCPYVDVAINCPDAVRIASCNHKVVAARCEASCRCKNEIK
ncbi:cysteine-rich secretory protein 1 [Phascolarctos cinereus]|uniref:Cysteine-rich secretory protein 1 n=1 Tax=Phascolarctos cinereus TaxID=38626 RepID=A0A6P5KWC0_PHACI|nr:cysteine-rich secretory protein 1 [Phascolarctos cinereus]